MGRELCRTLQISAVAVTSALWLTAAAAQGTITAEQAEPLAEPVTLKIGYLRSASLGNIFVAEHLGYFAAENIIADMEPITNSQDALVLLSQGRIDAITGSLSAALLNAIAADLDVRVVSSLSTIEPIDGVDEPPPSGMFMRADLVGEISDYADMKGRQIGSVGGLGTAVSYLVGLYAEAGGLTLHDFEIQSYSIPDALVALRAGRVDIAFLTAPISQEAIDQGVAVEFGDARAIYGGETQSAILFGPSLLNENRQAGAAFMRAMQAASDRMAGDYRDDPDVIAALHEWTGASEELLRRMPLYHMSPAFNPATLERMQAMFLNHGGLLSYSDPLPADRVLDLSFVEAAGGGS